MGRRKFPEDQIRVILDEYRAGASAAELCRTYGMSNATFYKWRAKYGEDGSSESRDVTVLEEENLKLKRLLAEMMLENHTLKSMVSGSSSGSWRRGE